MVHGECLSRGVRERPSLGPLRAAFPPLPPPKGGRFAIWATVGCCKGRFLYAWSLCDRNHKESDLSFCKNGKNLVLVIYLVFAYEVWCWCWHTRLGIGVGIRGLVLVLAYEGWCWCWHTRFGCWHTRLGYWHTRLGVQDLPFHTCLLKGFNAF